MAFEPLETDEKLDQPVQANPDMDAAMLFGCSGFVITSIGGYLLAVWPFIVFQDTERLTRLGLAAVVGLTPAAIVGIFATRKFRLAGACGFIGGSMATGIFLYLRLQQEFLAFMARQAPKPEYPSVAMYLIPLSWIVLSAILAIISLPSGEEM